MPVYVVEKILDHNRIDEILHYQVKWVGYNDPKDYTWEPVDNLSNCAQMITEYWEKLGKSKPSSDMSRDESGSLQPTEFWAAQSYPYVVFKYCPSDPFVPHMAKPGAFDFHIPRNQRLKASRKIASIDASGDVTIERPNHSTEKIGMHEAIAILSEPILDWAEEKSSQASNQHF